MKHAIVVALMLPVFVCVVLFGPWFPRFIPESPTTFARFDIWALQKAIVVYRDKHGAWPKDLAVLAAPQPDGSPAYIGSAALVDLWGRPYRYNPAVRNPNTGIPLIWSEGPEPGKEGSKIRNWVEQY